MTSEGPVMNAAEEHRQPSEDRMPRDYRPELTIHTTPPSHESNGSAPPRQVPRVSPYVRHNGMAPSASFGYHQEKYHQQPTNHLSKQQQHLRGIPHHLRSVVTTSFSVEDEHAGARDVPPRRIVEQRYEMEERIMVEQEDRDEWDTRSSDRAQRLDGASRGGKPVIRGPPSVHRTYSSPPYINSSESLKRSYYHHSRPVDQYAGGGLPADFMPPKRLKTNPVTPSPKQQDKVLLPRSMSDVREQEWNYSSPASSFYESREGQGSYRTLSRPPSFPLPPPPPPPPAGWNRAQPPSPMVFRDHSTTSLHGAPPRAEYAQASPRNEGEHSRRHWQHQPSPSHGHWGSPSHHQYHHQHHGPVSSFPPPPPPPPPPRPQGRFWDSPRSQEAGHHRQLSNGEIDGKPRDHHVSGAYSTPPKRDDGRMKMVVDAVAATEAADRSKTEAKSPSAASPVEQVGGSQVLLLSLPEDRVTLSETLCVVRENIEVFTASQRDVDAPAPGRKHAVVVGQVGLRCIHCRHTTRGSERVKRAVCYPSSIKRIYRTVIDMKLDHFSQCKFVPSALKARLAELKAVHTRSTGTTMQYFIQAAYKLGMTDGPSGVSIGKNKEASASPSLVSAPTTSLVVVVKEDPPKATSRPSPVARSDSVSTSSASHASGSHLSHRSDSMMSTDSFESSQSGGSAAAAACTTMPDQIYQGLVPLAMPEDKTALSPLRCFLRSQVCAFSATKQDIAVRAPTTFSIALGQVGIGCIHCVKQPAKLRSNRAVCFPFSIGRIYQSVADIQRFHLGECKMLPADVKQQFLELQSASSKGSKGLATRQYWVTSAKKIGLTDTPKGIRFGRDPSQPATNSAVSLDILAQVAFSVTTASKKLVLPQDKSSIADFLYVVMEQLQPCRFTEADRNKRRLKDVGCIGVECKHCAGQVDSRKFFWSSVNAVESNFVSVHTHMLECRMVPPKLKEHLIELKQLRKEQTTALKTGSQKAFFARVWQRLHEDDDDNTNRHHHHQAVVVPPRRPSYESLVDSGRSSSTDEDMPLASV